LRDLDDRMPLDERNQVIVALKNEANNIYYQQDPRLLTDKARHLKEKLRGFHEMDERALNMLNIQSRCSSFFGMTEIEIELVTKTINCAKNAYLLFANGILSPEECDNTMHYQLKLLRASAQNTTPNSLFSSQNRFVNEIDSMLKIYASISANKFIATRKTIEDKLIIKLEDTEATKLRALFRIIALPLTHRSTIYTALDQLYQNMDRHPLYKEVFALLCLSANVSVREYTCSKLPVVNGVFFLQNKNSAQLTKNAESIKNLFRQAGYDGSSPNALMLYATLNIDDVDECASAYLTALILESDRDHFDNDAVENLMDCYQFLLNHQSEYLNELFQRVSRKRCLQGSKFVEDVGNFNLFNTDVILEILAKSDNIILCEAIASQRMKNAKIKFFMSQKSSTTIDELFQVFISVNNFQELTDFMLQQLQNSRTITDSEIRIYSLNLCMRTFAQQADEETLCQFSRLLVVAQKQREGEHRAAYSIPNVIASTVSPNNMIATTDGDFIKARIFDVLTNISCEPKKARYHLMEALTRAHEQHKLHLIITSLDRLCQTFNTDTLAVLPMLNGILTEQYGITFQNLLPPSFEEACPNLCLIVASLPPEKQPSAPAPDTTVSMTTSFTSTANPAPTELRREGSTVGIYSQLGSGEQPSAPLWVEDVQPYDSAAQHSGNTAREDGHQQLGSEDEEVNIVADEPQIISPHL